MIAYSKTVHTIVQKYRTKLIHFGKKYCLKVQDPAINFQDQGLICMRAHRNSAPVLLFFQGIFIF